MISTTTLSFIVIVTLILFITNISSSASVFLLVSAQQPVTSTCTPQPLTFSAIRLGETLNASLVTPTLTKDCPMLTFGSAFFTSAPLVGDLSVYMDGSFSYKAPVSATSQNTDSVTVSVTCSFETGEQMPLCSQRVNFIVNEPTTTSTMTIPKCPEISYQVVQGETKEFQLSQQNSRFPFCSQQLTFTQTQPVTIGTVSQFNPSGDFVFQAPTDIRGFANIEYHASCNGIQICSDFYISILVTLPTTSSTTTSSTTTTTLTSTSTTTTTTRPSSTTTTTTRLITNQPPPSLSPATTTTITSSLSSTKNVVGLTSATTSITGISQTSSSSTTSNNGGGNAANNQNGNDGNNNNNNNGGENGDNTSVAVGIVLGVVGALALFGIAVMFYRAKQEKNRPALDGEDTLDRAMEHQEGDVNSEYQQFEVRDSSPKGEFSPTNREAVSVGNLNR